MKIVASAFLFFLAFVGYSAAATQNMCRDKVLDTGTVEGIYLGAECGDMCYAGIKLANGEDFYMVCGEEEAEKFFGSKPGQKISATYEVQQFWNEYAADCARVEVCKSGKILGAAAGPDAAASKSSAQFVALFTPKMLGVNLSYIEKKFGPAMRSNGNSHEFEIDGCLVTISGEKTVSTLELDAVSPLCSFDLAPFLQLGSPTPVSGLTFGDFDAKTGSMGKYTADCLSNCGNAYVPSVYESYEGSRSTGFLKVRLAVKLDADPALEAARIWETAMVKAQGEDWVAEQKFNEDTKYDAVARNAFKNVPITSILLGQP